MDIYINKRIVHLFLAVLLLLAASVTVVAAQQQQQLKQSAQTASTGGKLGYKQPPLYGCLQVGEGTNKGCASKLLKTELKVTLNGQDAEGKTVFYNQSLNADLKITNVGDLPVILSKVAVSGHPLNANYKVDFQPTKQNVTLNPKQSFTLSNTAHKFNSPDPGGPWKITASMYDDNGTLVTDTTTVDINVDTTCKALLRTQLSQTEIDTLSTKCKADKTLAMCNDFCLVFPDKCAAGGTVTGNSQGQAGQQGAQAQVCNPSTTKADVDACCKAPKTTTSTVVNNAATWECK